MDKTPVNKREYYISQLKKGKRIYVGDYKHILLFDMFQNVIVVGLTTHEPVRLATDADFDECFFRSDN